METCSNAQRVLLSTYELARSSRVICAESGRHGLATLSGAPRRFVPISSSQCIAGKDVTFVVDSDPRRVDLATLQSGEKLAASHMGLCTGPAPCTCGPVLRLVSSECPGLLLRAMLLCISLLAFREHTYMICVDIIRTNKTTAKQSRLRAISSLSPIAPSSPSHHQPHNRRQTLPLATQAGLALVVIDTGHALGAILIIIRLRALPLLSLPLYD